MRKHAIGALAATVLAIVTILSAAPAQAAPVGPNIYPSDDQITQVYNAMVANGISPNQAAQDVEDPAIRDWYPTTSSDELVVEATANTATTTSSPKTTNRDAREAAVGTSCTGSSKSGYTRRWFYTWWGRALGYAKINVYWCYNGSRVTYEGHSRSVYLTTDAQIAGWKFNSWTDSVEYFYTYNNHTNGGVKVAEEAYFQFCTPIKVVCASSAFVRPRVYVHYDGTWTA